MLRSLNFIKRMLLSLSRRGADQVGGEVGTPARASPYYINHNDKTTSWVLRPPARRPALRSA